MNTKKITDGEIADLRVASLPTRPTAPFEFGGKGYTALQMKRAFDKLPVFIVERLNLLIDDISSEPTSSISANMQTGIYDGHTLAGMFSDVKSGAFASYLAVFDTTLTEYLHSLRADITKIADTLGITLP